MRISSSIFLVFSLSLPAIQARAEGASSAQSPGSNSVEEARLHFQRGVQFFREASFEAALADFNRAYEIAPNYRILYNLAQVQAERHDYAAALKLFRAYLEIGGGEIPPERRTLVESDENELANRVAQISLDVNVKGAEVLLDGTAVGITPLPGPVLVNAGVRAVLVKKTGYVEISRQLSLVGGETSHLEGRMARELGADARADKGPGRSSIPLWIGAGATATLAAAWVTFAVLAQKADGDLETRLGEYPADRDRVASDRTREKSFAALADGFAAGTVVSLGFTVYAFLSTGTAREPAPSDGQPGTLKIVPMARGIELTGRF